MRTPWIVILAGGAGVRFWPASRPDRPKHVVPGLGGGGRTLLEATIERVLPLAPKERVFVMSCAEQEVVTRPLLTALPEANLLMEPMPRGTAPAIALALASLAHRGATAHDPVIVLPADAWVGDDTAFQAALLRACEAASAEKALCVLGLPATRPEIGYGWIETGDALLLPGEGPTVRKVAAFHEKPDLDTAMGWAAGGTHLWNAGIFVFRHGYLQWLLGHLDEAWDEVSMSLLAHIVSRDAKGLADDYAQLDVNSFDYAVLERAPEVLAVEAQFPWSDLGNWDAIARVLPALHGGHAVAERVLARDAKKNVVYAPGKSVLLLGIEGIVVAADGDDLLVMSRDRAQELKELVQRLRDP